MFRFRDLPLGRKLIVVGAAASLLALVVSSIAVLVATFSSLRHSVRQELQVQAQIVADNSSAAAEFEDATSATQIIAALHANSDVELACLYTSAGALLGKYERSADTCPAAPPRDESVSGPVVRIVLAVVEKDRRTGTLFVQGNFHQVRTRLINQAVAGVMGIGLGVLAAILLSSRVQRVIARPIEDLSTVASHISSGGDYSLRATKHSEDEVGQLVETFNAMLAEIERRDEQLRAAGRLKDEFLAALSHELRTPLNAVLGWIQVLRSAPTDDATRKRAYESIERNARAQASLIEDLLDISRIVSGKLTLKSEPVDLTAVVDAALEVMRPAAEAKGITVVRSLLPSPQPLAGDPNRLQQIVWNLLSNAVKFSREGGQIAVTLSSQGAHYQLEVRDNGIGIAPEFLTHVFDRFRQADGSTTRQYGGLGLGLAIARELTELHGGTIRVDSDGLDKGARFTVELPHRNVYDAPPATPLTAADAKLEGLSVLIVDDDQDARDVMSEALRASGADVHTANSADTALNSIAARATDVILCDLAMPGVDGYELIRRLRVAGGPDRKPPAAVAVSAHAGAAVEARTRAAGFQTFVSKPYTVDALLLAIIEARRLAAVDSAHRETAI